MCWSDCLRNLEANHKHEIRTFYYGNWDIFSKFYFELHWFQVRLVTLLQRKEVFQWQQIVWWNWVLLGLLGVVFCHGSTALNRVVCRFLWITVGWPRVVCWCKGAKDIVQTSQKLEYHLSWTRNYLAFAYSPKPFVWGLRVIQFIENFKASFSK